MTSKAKWPECEKLAEAREESERIGAFLDWLDSQGIRLMRWQNDDGWSGSGHVQDRRSVEQLLADYFKIDLKKVEEERRAILAEQVEARSWIERKAADEAWEVPCAVCGANMPWRLSDHISPGDVVCGEHAR